MVTLSAFADEISSDLQEQLDVLNGEGMRHIEFRGVWGKNVLDLSDDELKTVRDALDSRRFGISAIGSPIGKISIVDDFEPHVERFERAIHTANYFQARYIRVFSFFIPKDQEASMYREEVLRRMTVLTTRAAEHGVTLLHENEKGIYGDTPERCLDILSTVNSPNLRCAFDPANFVQCGVKPYSEAFLPLESFIDYLHIKDALMDGGRVVPAGHGDGELMEVLNAMFGRGYSGFLSIEPHLAPTLVYEGFSGPGRFHVAASALKTLLAQLHQTWQ